MNKHRTLEFNKLKGYIAQLAKNNQIHKSYSNFPLVADYVFELVEHSDADDVELLVIITQHMGTNTRVALQAMKLVKKFLST